MKTFNKKDVYSWSNAEDAKQYIGKEGYFSNNFLALKIKVKNCDELNMLKNIDSYGICCFNPNEHFEGFGLFLPADKVKEVEELKKWRAFKDLDDLKTYANKSVGSILVYRQKNKDNTMRTSVITDYVFSADCIFIGNRPFSFETLFEEYEWLNEHGIWQPFGVLENET